MKEALVVGLGAAGLFASCLLARKGWKVTAVGRGTPSTSMSTGCVRSKISGEAADELLSLFESSGLPMVGPDCTGVTNLGARFACSLSPAMSTWRSEDEPKGITVIGVRGHPSLRPSVAASAMSSWGMKAEAVHLPFDLPLEASLSNALDDEGFETLAETIRESNAETVLLPALFDLNDIARWTEMERKGGRRLLEAITPLGVPGQRFLNVMERGAVEAGAVLWKGRKVESLKIKDHSVEARILGGLEHRDMEFDSVLLANGGPLVDGMIMEGTKVSDPFRLFKVHGSGDPCSGLLVKEHKPLLIDGRTAENVFAAGDCVASTGRGYADGLAHAIESAWSAVRAMEGA